MQIDLFYELAVPTRSGRSQESVYRETLDEIALADGLGFGCAWVVEHHFAGEYSHSSAPELFLAAASQRTQRIRLGHGVVVLPFHHPIHVAERAAALDILSGGRLELGVGRGFSAAEYAAFGVQMRDSRQRVQEGIAILRHAGLGPLLQPPFEGLNVLPKPIQKPHPPLWTAAVSPESFTWAAREGLGVLCGPFKPWPLIRRDLACYREIWRASHGAGPPAPGHNPRFAMTLGVLCLENGTEARRLADDAFLWYYRRLLDLTRSVLHELRESYEYYRRFRALAALLDGAVSVPLLERLGMVVVGDPQECARRFARYEYAGVDHLVCSVGAGVLPTETVQRAMKTMADHLLPRFHR
jgi:alkanesulfonate monooxygenase SsuD/methylene tetrahydromethanopterin reductase-like flavin-dependent oxidoreductase (luciferase family)